jgi:predicted ATPase
MTLVNMGEFTSAREHLEQGIVLYDPQQHRRHAFRSGQDAGVVCLGHVAWDLWALGYPEQARHRLHEMLSLAEELSHPLSLTWAKCLAAMVYQFRREEQKIQEQVEVVIRLSHEHGFTQLLAQGIVWTGWLLVEKGQEEEGIRQIHQGLDAHRATGAEIYRPYFLALLAEAYGKVGQIEEGLTALAEALAFVDKTGECYNEAELYRLKGELTLQSSVQRLESRVKEAEECFLKAIEITRRQQAKSLELRATTSLARLWQQQGKQREARTMLSEIYHWFTEGFDTKDLQEAKALLDSPESRV